VGINRGFVSDYYGTFSGWVTHADRILPESVGLTVRLTTWPTYGYNAIKRKNWFVGDPEDVLFSARLQEPGDYYTPALSHRWPEVAAWELPPMTATYYGDGNRYAIVPT
jgi:hypothetical protein